MPCAGIAGGQWSPTWEVRVPRVMRGAHLGGVYTEHDVGGSWQREMSQGYACAQNWACRAGGGGLL